MTRGKLVTHYDNLKVANNAPTAVIRAAYRVLVQQFHPDRFPDRALGEHRLKIINKAYEVLSDAKKRREHDAWISAQKALRGAEDMLHAGPAASPHCAGAPAGSVPETNGTAPTSQWHDAPHERNPARPALHTWLPGLARLCKRLAVFGGIAWLAYVLAIEEQHVSPSPAAIENIGIPPASLIPPSSPVMSRTVLEIEDASRCFWVYAPLAELGRDFQHDELFQFGIERVKWLDAFIKLNNADRAFKRVFDSAIQRYQPSLSHFQNGLREALTTNDLNAFSSAMDVAVSCDERLGIRTRFIPRI